MNLRLQRVAVVGASTLKGKEVKDVLTERNFPAVDVKLLDDQESLGQLDTLGDEVTFIQSIRPEQFENVDFAFFASDAEFTRNHWRMARQKGARVVDLSYALEDEPGAAVRAPLVERELEARFGEQVAEPESPVVVAHPAAAALSLLLLRAQKAGGVHRAVATVFEPASEHGRRGLDELHQQTVSLLSFQQMPTAVFDSQVAFNMVSRYGEQSQPTLESVERRILRHTQQLTRGRAPLPSLVLLQAPIFHGHAFSVYIELEKTMSAGDFSQAVAGDAVAVARVAEDSPTNVGAAGQEQVLVAVRRDSQRENALWLWAATDNLRLAATTAVDCASLMLAERAGERRP